MLDISNGHQTDLNYFSASVVVNVILVKKPRNKTFLQNV